MSFFDYLERLREKPEPVRRKILLASSVALTLFIATLWLSGFRLEPLRGEEQTVERGIHPSVLRMREFGDAVRDVLGDVARGFGVVRNRVKKELGN